MSNADPARVGQPRFSTSGRRKPNLEPVRDRVTLTIQERQQLAALEELAISDDPRLHRALASGGHRGRVRSRRLADIAAVVLLVAGAVLTLTTFARSPLVGSIGVLLLAIGFGTVATRLWRFLASRTWRPARRGR